MNSKRSSCIIQLTGIKSHSILKKSIDAERSKVKESKPVAVKVLNKELQVNCPTGCEEQLFEAARFLDQKIREIRNHGRVISVERMIILAALNISTELLSVRRQKDADHRSINDKIKQLQNKIDGALIEDVAFETHVE